MKRALIIFAFATFLLACVQAALLPPFPAPAVFWSNQRYFTANQEQILSSVSEVEISDFISSLSGSAAKSAFSRFVDSSAQQPEVVVIFVEQESSPTREAYSFLQAFLESAASSVVAPYAYPEARVSSAIINKVPKAIVLSGLRSDDKVLNHFDNNRAILSDGKVDVVIVQVAHGDASLIASVMERLSGSSAIVGYAADDSFRAPEKSMRLVAFDELENDVVVEHTYGGDYWPADVWSGIVISVTLIVLLAIGIGCMFELQTPTKWEKTKRTIKEIN
jgi:hypothetical protein